MGNLSTPKSVQKLQMALHAKAKAEAGCRFYALYDKISREDILAHAYAQCRSNKGAPGVDGQDFADIDAYGVQRWLGELAIALRQETYRPEPIRRVFIPKANGKLRPLGISTLRDRVCMTAAMLVLEPIFEADLPPEQYAYRPGRNAQQAVVEVEALLFRGHPEVVDADLADYFGSIPHAELLKSVVRRIVDRRVLHLIKMWLECPVALSPSHPARRIVVMKSAQVGFTESGNCWIGYVIHHAPGPMLAVQPTVELAKRFSRQRIEPLISCGKRGRAAPALASHRTNKNRRFKQTVLHDGHSFSVSVDNVVSKKTGASSDLRIRHGHGARRWQLTFWPRRVPGSLSQSRWHEGRRYSLTC